MGILRHQRVDRESCSLDSQHIAATVRLRVLLRNRSLVPGRRYCKPLETGLANQFRIRFGICQHPLVMRLFGRDSAKPPRHTSRRRWYKRCLAPKQAQHLHLHLIGFGATTHLHQILCAYALCRLYLVGIFRSNHNREWKKRTNHIGLHQLQLDRRNLFRLSFLNHHIACPLFLARAPRNFHGVGSHQSVCQP